jgi:sedoheptulokinase
MGEVSPLFTWQDSRCDEDFLSTLPTPASNLRLATGYGCATIFWLQRNRPGSKGLLT